MKTGTIKLTKAQDVDDLIDDLLGLVCDLRKARKRSLRSGGCFAVFRKADDGTFGVHVAVEVGLMSDAIHNRNRRADDD